MKYSQYFSGEFQRDTSLQVKKHIAFVLRDLVDLSQYFYEMRVLKESKDVMKSRFDYQRSSPVFD